LKQAAKQFEAIFVRQMLGAARAAKLGGENDLFGGQAMDTFNSMQDERFAQIAADSGAFGLAKSIETQLAAQLHLSREGASTSPARADQGSSTNPARPEPVEGPHATAGAR
ncbi:MAG TPA: rod-binding protein, partial [Myxococcales bacterium]